MSPLLENLANLSDDDVVREILLLVQNYVGDFTKEEDVLKVGSHLKANKPEHLSNLVDTIWLLDFQLENDIARIPSKAKQPNKELRNRLIRLITQLRDKNILSSVLLKERLEPSTLEATRVLGTTAEAFNKRSIRVNTGLLYRQQRFNLLREENEGYSKLICELNDTDFDRDPATRVSMLLLNIEALIGYFSLDPNKVLDVILEVYEQNLSRRDIFLSLIKKLSGERTSVLANILGFKYQFHQSEKTPTPLNLYQLTAHIIQHNLVELKAIYPHLSPTDDEMKVFYAQFLKDSASIARKGKVEEGDAAGGEVSASGNAGLLMDARPTDQKLGVCCALFEIGDIKNGMAFLSRLPPLHVARIPSTTEAVFKYIHRAIEPLYSLISPSKFTNPKRDVVMSEANHNNKEKFYTELQNFDELVLKVFPILTTFGLFIYRDPILIAKMCRLCDHHLNSVKSDDTVFKTVLADIELLIQDCLLPGISMLHSNPGMGVELWNVLTHFPYETRYRIYFRCKEDHQKIPELMIAKAQAAAETRRILKRLSKDNVRQFGRQLGKVSHSSPTSVFAVILEQIQSYDNLIQHVSDSLKYLTPLGFDILAFSTIEALAVRPQSDRVKYDGLSISDWLQNLATLVGSVFQKYKMIDLDGTLHYIVNQLKAQNSFDLIVLKELLQKMGGLENIEEYTTVQLEALSGGETLRSETFTVGVRNIKRSSQRLMNALLDTKLALPLAVLIAQQQSVTLLTSESQHLKMLSSQFDQCMETLTQYIDFIRTNVEPAVYDKLFPSVPELCSKYHMEPPLAFFVSRPKIAYKMMKHFESGGSDDENTAYHSNLSGPISQIQSMLPSEVWNGISPQFYFTFWQLSLYDIFVPKERYRELIQKHSATISAEDLSDPDRGLKAKKEKERCQHTIDKLEKELSDQKANYELVMKRLNIEKELWFADSSSRFDTITQLIQHCIFPRCILSASDAVFCARFIAKMHDIGSSNFSSLSFYDRIVSDISLIIFSCTATEASHYGSFLAELLSVISRWYMNSKYYQEEAITKGRPGFRQKWKARGPVDESSLMRYEEFRKVTYKWHVHLYKAISTCLVSKEYMQSRNAMIILTKIKDYFPMFKKIGEAIITRFSILVQDERPDLKIIAQRCLHMISECESKWVDKPDDSKEEDNTTKALPPEDADGKSKRRKVEDSSSTQSKDDSSRRKEEDKKREDRDAEKRKRDTDSKKSDKSSVDGSSNEDSASKRVKLQRESGDGSRDSKSNSTGTPSSTSTSRGPPAASASSTTRSSSSRGSDDRRDRESSSSSSRSSRTRH